MKLQQGFCKTSVALGLALILAGVAQVPRSAWASMEDAAIFYDELKDQGEWVDYGNHGPVWYPTQVQENWRPYVDGRWTPSEEGYVFETQEPWAPSTYHYGNWMPTPEYGWVWVPGRTWYPNTVAWRTSPESAAPDASYIGWAPIPPQDYTPAQGYYPPNYGGGPYSGSLDSLMTSPFWIFVRAASFLLGLNAPYSPAYSYWGSYSLVPIQAVPYYYSRTVIVNNYYSPSYYPAGYIAPGGYYNWGPSIPYVARVTRIKQGTINNYMRQVNIYQRRNVVPPPAFVDRHPHFRDVLPPAMVARQPIPRGARIHTAHVARNNLVRPNLVNASMMKNTPKFSATIPRAKMESGPWHRGVPGAALPSSAIMRPNRQMEQRIRNIPSSRRLEPVSPSARKWNVPQTPGAAAVQPGPTPRHRGPEVTSGPGPTTPGAVPSSRGPQRSRQTITPGTPGAPGTPQAVVPRERFKPRERQTTGPWGRHEQAPQSTITPRQYPRQRQMQASPPGTPPATTATPPQSQPQRRFRRQQPMQQQQQPASLPSQPQRQTPLQPTHQRQAPQHIQPMKQAPMQSQPRMHQQQPFQPPQVQRQPMRQPQQVQRQPMPQPQQVQRQPQRQMQPQMHQQHRPQQQPQGQPQPQGSQQQRKQKQHNQQNQ